MTAWLRAPVVSLLAVSQWLPLAKHAASRLLELVEPEESSNNQEQPCCCCASAASGKYCKGAHHTSDNAEYRQCGGTDVVAPPSSSLPWVVLLVLGGGSLRQRAPSSRGTISGWLVATVVLL